MSDNPQGTESPSSPFGSKLGPLFLLTGIFFLNFISRIILAPLLPAIEKDLGVSHGEAGSLFLLISLGYFVSLLASGFVSSRLMHRRTIILSASAVGMALVAVSACHSLLTVRLGLLLLGLAAGLYLPSGIATLTALVDARHWGKAIAIHELAPNLSFVAAPLVTESLLLWFSWRGVLLILGVATLAMGGAYVRFGRGGRFPGQAPSFTAFRTLFREPAFWIMMLLFSLGIGGTLGVYAMLPLYLVTEHGIHRNWANTLLALSRIPGLGMAFLAGWITDRLRPPRTMAIVFLLTGLATVLLGKLSGSWVLALVFIQPILAVCFFPPGFAALSSVGPPHTRNVAVSLTVPVGFMLGGGAVPTAVGLLGDAGSFSLGIVLVGGLILTGTAFSLWLKSGR